jgi:hypothetical protein
MGGGWAGGRFSTPACARIGLVRARRFVTLALAVMLAAVGCKKGSGTSDGGIDAGDDACDLSKEPRFDAGPSIPSSAPLAPNFFDVWGATANDVHVVGSAGLVAHWNGVSWSQTNIPDVGDLLSVWGSATNDVYAVGLGGAIVHWDGTTWTRLETPMDDGGVPMGVDLHAVSGGGLADVWVVGVDATLWHSADGLTWNAVRPPTQETLNGIWIAPGGGAGVAVGNLGTIIEWDGGSWNRRRITGLTAHLKGVWGWDPGNVFALGLNGTLATNQGGTWAKLAPSSVQPRDLNCQQGPAAWPSVYLRDAWGAEGRIFLVGWNGTIMVGANNVATVYQVTENRLESIWGTMVIDTPGQGDGGIPDGGLEYHYEATIVGVTGAIIRVRLAGNP